MDPQFRIDGVSDGVLLAMEWASNCVFRLFERVCDVAAIWIILQKTMLIFLPVRTFSIWTFPLRVMQT
jgi:hypothetical protein